MNDAINALAPCPFCGGRANIYENEVDFVPKWSVGCGDCNANMDVCEDEKAEAAEAWNTRALRPEPSAADALSPTTEVRREAIGLADQDEIGRLVLSQPWEVQQAIVTIAAHCTALIDECPTGQIADLAGCISLCCLELAHALPCADEAAIRADEREKCAKIAERIFGGKAHTYASENADVYRAQDEACERIAQAIRNGGKQP